MGAKVSYKLEMKGVEQLKRRLRKLESKSLEWGFLGGTHEGSGLTMATLASFLEYGGVNNHGYDVPPRPAFGTLINTLRASNVAYELDVAKAFRDYLEGRTSSPEVILRVSGEHVTDRHKDTMYNWLSDGTKNTDNAPMTISMKGFNMPFVDSGELVQGVEYRTN